MSQGLANILKKKFNKYLDKEDIPNTSNGKNVSWSEDYEFDFKSKKPFRSTPYPNTKKMKRSNTTSCKALSFDDTDSEDSSTKENTFTTTRNILELCKPKTQGTKRKRLSANWEVTSCDIIRPDKSNQKCKDNRLEETLIPDILENNSISEIESSSSDSETEEKIFKLTLSNKKCKIIEPDTNILDISDQNKIEEITVEEQCDELKNEEITTKKLRFGKLVRFFMGEDYCILFLKHPLKLYFNGKLSIKVLFGSVEILGSIQNNKKQITLDVYSPRGQSFLCLETTEYGLDSKDSLQKILIPYNIPSKQLKEFLYNLGKDDCVLLVKTINNNLTNYLSSHISQYLYPKPIHCEKTIENKLHCLFELEENSWKVFRKDELLKCCAALTENTLPISVMLCGGKSVGKSTLFRYMTNYFLNKVEKVVCIDLDPGQADFTIGGCVSVTIIDKPILGPSFTHLQTPVKSFFVGDVNVMNCIDRYIISVQELMHFCENNVTKEYPWIINYMGFSKSLGCDLTAAIIKIVNPTTVVQISSSARNKNYPIFLTKENVENYIYSFPIITPEVKLNYNLLTVNSAAEEKIEGDFQFEARPLREMSIISYFSQMVEQHGKEITSLPPFSVKLSSIKLHDLNYSKENILATINGNLVALCKTKTEQINKETAFECFGFGIIRGIDKDSQELYLLTPVHEENLNNVNSLIRGNINLPPSLYMTIGRQGLVPYILLGNQQGTNKIPKRFYMNLKALLKKK